MGIKGIKWGKKDSKTIEEKTQELLKENEELLEKLTSKEDHK